MAKFVPPVMEVRFAPIGSTPVATTSFVTKSTAGVDGPEARHVLPS